MDDDIAITEDTDPATLHGAYWLVYSGNTAAMMPHMVAEMALSTLRIDRASVTPGKGIAVQGALTDGHGSTRNAAFCLPFGDVVLIPARPRQLTAFMEHARTIGADVMVDAKTPAELAAILDAIGSHNKYDHHKTVHLLGPVVGELQRLRVHHFTGGPRIHLHLPAWTGHSIAAQRGPWSGMGEPADSLALAAQLRQIGKDLHASEIGCRQLGMGDQVDWRGTGERPVEITLWWG